MYRLIVIAILYIPTTAFAAKVDSNTKEVIKSGSGLCHGPGSSYRETTKSFVKDYDSYLECFKDKGKISIPDSKRLEVLNAYKQAYDEGGSNAPDIKDVAKAEEKAEAEQSKDDKFLGLDWGLGIAVTSLSGGDVIDEVTIEQVTINSEEVNQIRVDKASEFDVELMLEFHKFIFRHEVAVGESVSRTWGHGPFASIGLTGKDGKDPLDTFAIGWMFGTRLSGEETSFNVGIGWYVDSEVERLRDGNEDGGITTETDPSKLLTTRDDTGWMLIFSAQF